jgi:hypothetical protein
VVSRAHTVAKVAAQAFVVAVLLLEIYIFAAVLP